MQRLQCAQFLDQSYAERLLKCLEEDVDWSTILIEDKRMKEQRSEMRSSPGEAPELAEIAYQSARRGFAYYFDANRLTSPQSDGEGRVRAPIPAALQELDTLLNSEEGLEVFRRVTSIPALARTDLMATRYCPGHFLAFHDDEAGDKRKAAFVINLTLGWKPAWGGLLQFLSTEGQIIETFVPRFNALHLFKVPQLHSVSFVTPFAQGNRYAISGWLYTE
jgi:hypothetical protein